MKIIIDCVIFQLQACKFLGISRIWQYVISELGTIFTKEEIILLTRKGFPIGLTGFNEVEIPCYQYFSEKDLEKDDLILSQTCKKLDGDVFMSTYYTRSNSIRNILLVYDLIPEVMNLIKPNDIIHQSKLRAINKADKFITISRSTKKDLKEFYGIPDNKISIAYCGVSEFFYPSTENEIHATCKKFKISKPYFLFVGNRGLYKNSIGFLRAFSSLAERNNYQVVMIGGGSLLPEEKSFKNILDFKIVSHINHKSNDIRSLYSGAVALMYPSKYEGFGMPVIEAMACGCPVITVDRSSLPEVGGKAALYISDPDDDKEIRDVIFKILNYDNREELIYDCIEQSKLFRWNYMAQTVAYTLMGETKNNNLLLNELEQYIQCGNLEQWWEKHSNESSIEILALVRMYAQKTLAKKNLDFYYKLNEFADQIENRIIKNSSMFSIVEISCNWFDKLKLFFSRKLLKLNSYIRKSLI